MQRYKIIAIVILGLLLPVYVASACTPYHRDIKRTNIPEDPVELNDDADEEDAGTENPGGGEGTLVADGNDAGTYALILASGYNYETPDNSGDHANEPFRHIRQVYDDFLKKYVFDFYLHLQNDDDRGKANILDRQRNEIKTDGKSPASMVAQNGETLRISWKFKLPAGMKTTSKFSHVHQIKGIDNAAGNADVGHPLITFTCRGTSSQQLQVIYTAPESSTADYLAKVNLADFLGEWVSVVETIKFGEKGNYSVVITRIRDSKQLVKLSNVERNFWREGASGMRPKWGLYRNFGTNRSLADQLRDEILEFADFKIEKL